MHYATKCIIASSECATLKDASSAGRVITVLLLVLVPCLFTGGLISKSAITTYCTLKCALSDLMHCFLKHLVGQMSCDQQ